MNCESDVILAESKIENAGWKSCGNGYWVDPLTGERWMLGVAFDILKQRSSKSAASKREMVYFAGDFHFL